MSVLHETDVAVIGGGIVGVCSAYHLARRGAGVTLFERGAVGTQASGVNFGGLRTNGRAEAELPLSLRAQGMWAQINDLVGDSCEVEMTGHIEACEQPQHMAEVELWAKMAKSHGVAAELLSAHAVAQRFPWIGRKMLGGCFVAADGAANPRLAAPNFALAARKLGVMVHEFDPITLAAHDGERFHIESRNGLKVAANILVNAAGAWGARFAAWFGETFALDVMAPQMVVSEPFPRLVTATVDFPVNGRYFYARQIARGNLLFGRGPGRADLDKIRSSYVPQNLFDAAHIAVDLLPALRGRQIIRSWSGIEGKTADSLPYLGVSRAVPNLIHAFGFSGHGFQLGPATGAVVAELALDRRTSTEIAAFNPYRFAQKAEASGNAA